jgi:SAM-dependent methyltransferase
LDVLRGKIASAGVKNMHPIRLDLVSEPLPAEKYHVTYSLLALHHIHDARGILSKFRDVLEPNGYLIVADLDKEDGTFHTDGTTDVHLGFARSELQEWVETAGFGNVRFSTAYEIKKEVNGKEKAFPVFLMVAQKI